MKTTKKQFEEFKAEFKRWQGILGLTDWEVFFSHQELEDTYATINADSESRTAAVAFNTEVSKPEQAGPKESGKHEALHLLISDLDWIARSRYTSHKEIYKANEAIVRRLEKALE